MGDIFQIDQHPDGDLLLGVDGGQNNGLEHHQR